MKNGFLFHLKSYCRSQDIQSLVFPTSPQFFLVSHCLRGWFKINLKVYDVSSCLNKNLITHFVCVWYLEKEKRYDIETLLIDRALSKKYFFLQKLSSESQSKTPLQFWQVNQNSYCMQENVLKWDILKENYQKAFKKLTSFFLPNPISFN